MPVKIRLAQPARSPDALGHILACQFEVNAPQPAAACRVNIERTIELAQDIFEIAGLNAGRRGTRIAMHRVAAPQQRLSRGAGGFDQRRQKSLDGLRSEPVDQRKAAGFIVRLQDADEFP